MSNEYTVESLLFPIEIRIKHTHVINARSNPECGLSLSQLRTWSAQARWECREEAVQGRHSAQHHHSRRHDLLAGELHLHQGGLWHKVGGLAMVGWESALSETKGANYWAFVCSLVSGDRREVLVSHLFPKGVPIMALFPYLKPHTEEPSS